MASCVRPLLQQKEKKPMKKTVLRNQEGGNLLRSINPVNESILAEYKAMTSEEADATVDFCHAAFEADRGTSFEQRGAWMNATAKILRCEKEKFAHLITLEMGKARRESLSEVEKCAWVCEYYAEHAAHFLKEETIPTDWNDSFVTYQPLGVILALMPWNFPFWQVFRFAAPNLMAGNAAVLKLADNVSGCALAIEDIFRRAGFPENLFRTLLIGKEGVGGIIAHRHVRAITLTGSVAAGRSVAAQAGAYLKKTVLELGGSDPYIVFADADIEKTAEICATSRLINAGQSCIAAKRFIVVGKAHDAFADALKTAMQRRSFGDPSDAVTDIGPLASAERRDKLHQQVMCSVDKGAKCILGGAIPGRAGAFYPPTILTGVKDGMPAWSEELFGPVAPIIWAADEDEAIAIANATPFGLGCAIFSRDPEKARSLARSSVHAGTVAVNGYVKSDPRLPFGGIKDSGYGRELAVFGIREFMNVKTICVGDGDLQ
jgi:succinate-semialdehyde dehydrogenase / glutarate-semialdehyde dehydrogenase